VLQAVADTHAIIWYLYDDSRLSAAARSAIEAAAGVGDEIGFSSITLAEIVYLSEKGRVQAGVLARVLAALDEPAAVLRDLPFDRAVAGALSLIDRSEIADLPDRIIAATARVFGVPLITRDRRIQLSDIETIW
jgi:PIN domain nuclease of toxin-antitoxin system